MSEVLFTVVLALAWFGAVNVLVSALAAAGAWLTERRVFGLGATAAPGVLLALKLLPAVSSLLFTVAVFLPAHWIFEPKGVEESLGYTLVALGALGAAVLAMAGRRALRDSRATRDLSHDWERRAVGPRQFLDGTLPVYGVEGPAPVIALAGLRRPRVYVAEPVLGAFSEEELDVSLAHEVAHRDAHDNLKRLLAACAPDVLSLWAVGRRLEHRWRAAAEFAADAAAVSGSEERAVSLASALLKVARLTPALRAASPGAAFYDGTLLWARIDRLLAPTQHTGAPGHSGIGWPVSLGGLTLVAGVVAAETVWLGVHLATEGLVRFLP